MVRILLKALLRLLLISSKSLQIHLIRVGYRRSVHLAELYSSAVLRIEAVLDIQEDLILLPSCLVHLYDLLPSLILIIPSLLSAVVAYLYLACASLKASPDCTISCSFLHIRSSNYRYSLHVDTYSLLCG